LPIKQLILKVIQGWLITVSI